MGTIAVGLFATDTAPAFARGLGDGVTFGANQIAGKGLFYGGGFKQLGLQLLGMGTTALYTAVLITITFLIIKAVMGLRVTEEEEIVGLDAMEHGLQVHMLDFLLPILLWQWMSTRTQILVRVSTIRHLICKRYRSSGCCRSR